MGKGMRGWGASERGGTAKRNSEGRQQGSGPTARACSGLVVNHAILVLILVCAVGALLKHLMKSTKEKGSYGQGPKGRTTWKKRVVYSWPTYAFVVAILAFKVVPPARGRGGWVGGGERVVRDMIFSRFECRLCHAFASAPAPVLPCESGVCLCPWPLPLALAISRRSLFQVPRNVRAAGAAAQAAKLLHLRELALGGACVGVNVVQPALDPAQLLWMESGGGWG